MNRPPNAERRPDQAAEATSKRVGDSISVYAIPTVSAVIRLNVRRVDPSDWHCIDRIVQEASYAPSGATVIIEVRKGQAAPSTAIMWLRDNASHVGRYVIECEDTITLARWIDAFRDHGGCR